MMEDSIIETNLGIEILHKCSEQGCFSTVYFAIEKQTLAHVVVKVIKKSDLEEEYFNEARKLYASRHPNVVEIKCASDNDDHIFLIMEKYEGSISSLMEKRFLTVRECIKFALDALSGIHHIHTKGLIHFDIKPSNLLLTNNNRVLLSDFGLSRYVDSSGFNNAPTMHNLHLPPEAFSSQKLTSLSDIYQMGVTLYRMVNGGKIWKENISNVTEENFVEFIRKGKFPDRKLYLPHVPIPIRKVINKAMHINPDSRYQSALDFQNALSREYSNLDWSYELKGDIQKWIRPVNGGLEVLEIEQKSQNTFESEHYKINSNSGVKRKKRNGCQKNINISDINEFCTKILSE